MVARVGDLGLARILNKIMSKSSSQPRSTNSVTLIGSIGYAAPGVFLSFPFFFLTTGDLSIDVHVAEYGTGHKVSVQGDVYSFGMLLLEMFTAKRPTDDGFKYGLNLHHYVERALPKHVVEIIDPNLLLGGGEGEADELSMRAVECIASVLRVGVSCSKGSPKERMQMEGVVKELHTIKDRLYGGSRDINV
ncbi:hypothetical protein GW17_00045318 [Ensete ventricosum]|nr:hypothetical protein GW17_00045318 [Ensete ventricosum]